MGVHLVEIALDVGALMRFLKDARMEPRRDDEDLGYGIHTWLVSAFGPLSPKPWRLFMARRRPAKILGYAPHDAEALREQLNVYATPGAYQVLPHSESSILSKPMPEFTRGRLLAFEVLTVPIARKSSGGEAGDKTIEKDLFLHHVEQNGGKAEASRAELYGRWVKKLLEEREAAVVHAARLEGFRLVRQARYTHGKERKRRQIVRPQALIRGELTVNDPEAFSALLAHGIGRHRAFGYGMLLLRPVR
ncbi:MAG: type I-E CRISPR-associated protein Cas6/Cse3/CasE [Clostridiales bacterium]|uniref:CRISPR-associated protein, Cse3 family n=1 Tax=Hydrogenibacillus schlegelii TaxID=1484 RepID=A0A2T5G9G0_HYDSH|nr:type I-E CRISPR-associated protein Cas6/Cse3/CasE [Hydrogenibacillus schlegelii]MBT9258214.1 type I-E CRISPR-associated protein Cas6/Cse3/CasE [Clostridiales bacterium]PTQ52810.1 MAG: CRISPR-associated protein, Cse3 family [Hydrogenibacillus schlegelii]